ncbi:MAG TPA: hydroxymyristoyl-ACP dehydratase [Burkholderiaceae bacterium]|nr:hydroxymyristoyl-ACP dehydratase [Burkholderiaceae bacterium]
MSAAGTAQLDQAAIAALIPHAGRMCLLARCLGWDTQRIRCQADSHRDAGNPLRSASGLLAPVAIEYAAQAMALHGGLLARAAGGEASPGFLASARQVELLRDRLDDLAGPLDVEAERQAGDERQILYAFTVSHAGQPLVRGRAAVVLNTPLG